MRAYREAINAALENKKFDLEEWNKKTEAVFTRGFTKGHLGADVQNDRMNPFWPGNSGVKIGTVKSYEKDRKRMKILIEDTLNVGDEVQIRRGNGSVGARVEFIEIGRARVKSAQGGQEIIMNMQYPVKADEVIYRTVDDALLKEARLSFARQVQRVAISMKLSIKEGQDIALELSDLDGNTVQVSGDKPEKAMNKALDIDRVKKQILKLGDSPYLCSDPIIELDDGLALSMKSLNGLRRDAIEQLDELRTIKYPSRANTDPVEFVVSEVLSTDEEEEVTYTLPEFNVQVRTLEQLRAALNTGVDALIVSNLTMLKTALEETEEIYCKVIFAPGRIVRDVEYKLFEDNLDLIKSCAGIWAGTYGLIPWANKNDVTLLGLDQGLNVFNSKSVDGHDGEAPVITLSPEMTMNQIRLLDIKHKGLEAVVYGRQTVMITEYCPISATLANGHTDCGLCEQKNYGLQDKKGAIFPILRSNKACRTEILNSKILFVPEELDHLYDFGVRSYRMVFTLETAEDVEKSILLYKKTMDHDLSSEDEAIRNQFVAKGLTRGHYYRGVLTDE